VHRAEPPARMRPLQVFEPTECVISGVSESRHWQSQWQYSDRSEPGPARAAHWFPAVAQARRRVGGPGDRPAGHAAP
jgi:hypothetical protein